MSDQEYDEQALRSVPIFFLGFNRVADPAAADLLEPLTAPSNYRDPEKIRDWLQAAETRRSLQLAVQPLTGKLSELVALYAPFDADDEQEESQCQPEDRPQVLDSVSGLAVAHLHSEAETLAFLQRRARPYQGVPAVRLYGFACEDLVESLRLFRWRQRGLRANWKHIKGEPLYQTLGPDDADDVGVHFLCIDPYEQAFPRPESRHSYSPLVLCRYLLPDFRPDFLATPLETARLSVRLYWITLRHLFTRRL